jgi:glycosyltransferase involved in cell wall biosynthesis
MNGRILHVLSQRPSRTGSGVTLEAVVRLAGQAGWDQAAVVGVPAGEPAPAVADLPARRIFPVTFADGSGKQADLPFPVPGMSDVMPYPSSVWSRLTADQLARYRRVWRDHLAGVIARFRPHVIHANHVWLVSSLLPDIAPQMPLLVTCHATGLRQMQLCDHLADEVVAGCRRARHFFALRQDHRDQLARLLEVDAGRITVTGVGFRDDLFHRSDRTKPDPDSLLFVGKYSRAKGLPWLLDAFDRLRRRRPAAVLHVAGDGSGPEAEQLRQRMAAMAPAVVRHGQLGQHDLAGLMRRCRVCVLPSFYEGVPLVLAEAAACGCRVVATDLPGVMEQLAHHLGEFLHPVALPELAGIDTPVPEQLPAFVDRLCEGLSAALDQADPQGGTGPGPELTPLTWNAVFQRVEGVWRQVMKNQGSP